MSSREKAQIVVVSVAIALALAVGFYYVVGRISTAFGPGGTGGGSDDEPIIMAGGSLYIGTGDTATFNPAKTDDGFLYYHEGYRVFRIDVTDMGDERKEHPVNQAYSHGEIVVAYCKNRNCNSKNQADTVTMTFDNRATDPVIKIGNTLEDQQGKRTPISKAPRMLPTLRTHWRKDKDWTIYSVMVTETNDNDGSKYEHTTDKCGPYSECEVVVHTCLTTNPCEPN